MNALDLATSSIIKADKIKQQEELKIQLDKDQKVKTKAIKSVIFYPHLDVFYNSLGRCPA